jgi:hypothetical protein
VKSAFPKRHFDRPVGFAGLAASGLWLLWVAVLAVFTIGFTIGAGHVSLNQIHSRGERGRRLAIAALVIG